MLLDLARTPVRWPTTFDIHDNRITQLLSPIPELYRHPNKYDFPRATLVGHWWFTEDRLTWSGWSAGVTAVLRFFSSDSSSLHYDAQV